MNTNTEPNKPDYGEPWRASVISNMVVKRDCQPKEFRDEIRLRSIACVNACAGMVDPAKEIKNLQWVPVTDRMPTVEDANEYHDVEWSDGVERWDNQFTNPNIGNRKATHWRRITLP